MFGLNINKNVPFYAADIIKDAGLSSAISGRYMDTVIARKYTDVLTKGLRDGKSFDEIDINIDDELTALSSGTFYVVMIVLLALSLISLIIFSLPLSVSRIYLPVLFVIYAGLEYMAFNVILSKAAILLSNRLLGRTASLNLTYANTDLISYVSLGVVLAIIMNIAYRKMKDRA